MHFGWSRSRGILQPTRLPLQKRSHAWRYVGFDRPHPRRFSVPKIHRRIFEAQRSIAKSQINAALIWLREIGGMKWHGFVRNGICNWITEFWRAVTEAVGFGKSTEFMTEGTRNLRFVNRESRAAVTIHDV